MIIDDIPKVVYAPQKVFKNIVANPKYLGAIIILALFVAVQVGYEYSQFSKTNIEQTAPTVDQLPAFINASAWTASSDIMLTNNFVDYYNNSVYIANFGTTPTDPSGYYSLFGNSSLQIEAENTNNLTVALGEAFNVDSSETGFQNLSMTIKQVQPQTAPQSATLKLYSLSDNDFYQYDLTSEVSTASIIDEWGTLTVPIGKTAEGWTSTGAPSWSNITALTLEFSYPESTDVNMRIGALFFRGLYMTPVEFNSSVVLLQFVQVFTIQFIAGWLILTGVLYILFRAFKSTVVWKPLFIALGFALFVMVIRGLVNLAATLTLPELYAPFDMALGLRFNAFGAFYYPTEAVSALSAQSQLAFSTFEASTAAFMAITTAIFIISYAWLAILSTIIIGILKPELSLIKRITMATVAVAATILLLLFIIGVA